MREGLKELPIRYVPEEPNEHPEGSREFYLAHLHDLRHGWQDMPEHELTPEDYEESTKSEVGKQRFTALSRNKRRAGAWFSNVINWTEMAVENYLRDGPEKQGVLDEVVALQKEVEKTNIERHRVTDEEIARGDALLDRAIAALSQGQERPEKEAA